MLKMARTSQAKIVPKKANLNKESSRHKPSRKLTGFFFVAPAIIYLLLVSIYPLLRTIQMSLTTVDRGVWRFVWFQNYTSILYDPWFWNSARAIFIFTAASMILHIVIGMAFALALNEPWGNIVLRNFVRGLLILPWVFSTAASALMWSLLYHPYGLLNYIAVGIFQRETPIEFLASPGMAMTSIIIVNTWKSYPFYMIVILGGLQSIPIELYEAAKVDGANTFRRFWHITLPQLRPILIAISTIDIISTFGHVDLIRMLTRGGPLRTTEVIAYYIYKTGLLDGNLGYGAAISTLMLIGLSVFAFFYLRLLSRGGETGETSF